MKSKFSISKILQTQTASAFLKKYFRECRRLYSRFPFSGNKKILILLSAALVLIIASSAFSYFLFFKKEPLENERVSRFKDVKLSGVFPAGQKVLLGNLEFTANNVNKGSYTTFERDELGRRIEKQYISVFIKVFNVSISQKQTVDFELLDDLGNAYSPDYSITSYLSNVRGFTRDKNVYPSTIREGYLLFPAVHPDAKKLRFVVRTDYPDKPELFPQKIAFEFVLD